MYTLTHSTTSVCLLLKAIILMMYSPVIYYTVCMNVTTSTLCHDGIIAE